MHVILDHDDEEDASKPEPLTDPIIQRYIGHLHALTVEFIRDTEDYNLNQDQIGQFLAILSTLPTAVVFAQDLATLDAMLGMTFPHLYHMPEDDVILTLTNFPLSTQN